MIRMLSLVGLMLFVSAAPLAQRDWNAPFPAHRVTDNIYFVGTEALGTFLVTTAAGHILINSDFEATGPGISRTSTRKSSGLKRCYRRSKTASASQAQVE